MSADSPAGLRRLPVPDRDLEERSLRARREAMAVRSSGPMLYEVHSESGNTYLVDPESQRCTCPDHVIRGERCKHLRRVAIEINEGRVPPPGKVAEPCAVCGDAVYVSPDAEGPQYCPAHRISVGDRAIDRESGTRVLVVGVSDRPADEVTVPGADCTVAEYPGNERYDPADRVVAAVYPSVEIGPDGPRPGDLRVYSFPRGRLTFLDR